MRIRTTNETLYTFDELEESAQEKAMERIAQMNHEYLDPADITYQFELELEEWGFPTDKIEWSLSYSQGDGVAFYGTIDVDKYLEKTKQKTKYRSLTAHHFGAWLHTNSYSNFYSHYNTMNVETEFVPNSGELPTDKQEALAALLTEAIEEHVVDVSQNLEKMGYAELDYICSREYIVEEIEINEWEFHSDGRMA